MKRRDAVWLALPFPAERSGANGRYFGGGDPPAQTTTTQVNQLYSPEEAALRAKAMREAERIYGITSANLPNLTPGGPSAETQASQAMLKNFASGTGADLASQMAAATKFGMSDVLNPASNPALQSTINTATRYIENQYTDPGGVLSQIRGQFTGGNSGGSGSREGIAGGLAARSYLDTVGDVTGKITSDAYNKGLDVFSRTMALAPQNQQLMLQPALMTGAVGQQKEAYDERARSWEANSPWIALGPYANIVTGMANPSTQTTSTVPGAQANPMAPLGMAMMGASLGSAIMPGMGTAVGAGAGLLLSLFS